MKPACVLLAFLRKLEKKRRSGASAGFVINEEEVREAEKR